MDREIKLRAWDEINKKMWYSNEVGESLGEWAFQLYFDDGGILRAIIYREIDVGFVQKDCQEHQLPSMMFIGLPDKNGKEIYEGDILRVWRDGSCRTFQIKWRGSGVPMYILYPQPLNEGFWNIRSDMPMSWEVIGNIYESPELLESGVKP